MGVTLLVSDRVSVAVDVTAMRVWFRRNGAGFWNNSGAADPATGTGGFPLILNAPFYAYVALANNVVASATLHGTADRFLYPVPAGFGPI
jgi:hypothetical protein